MVMLFFSSVIKEPVIHCVYTGCIADSKLISYIICATSDNSKNGFGSLALKCKWPQAVVAQLNNGHACCRCGVTIYLITILITSHTFQFEVSRFGDVCSKCEVTFTVDFGGILRAKPKTAYRHFTCIT